MQVAPLDEFAAENAAMEAFVEERAERFVLGSRGAVVEELLTHATKSDGNSYIFHKCGAPQNNGHYCNKDVDQWIDESRKVSKLEERKAVYEKIADKFLQEGSIIYLYRRLVIIAHSAKLEGYTQLPDGLVRVVGVKLKP